MTERSLTTRIATFAAELPPEAIPDDIRQQVKLHLLDSLGCALSGGQSDLMARFFRALAGEYAPGPCPVPGTAHAFGPAAAAFATATAMNALDYDDGFEIDGRGLGHPGATLCAAALSGIWGRQVDGLALLTALTAAYEINGRLILSLQPSPSRFRQIYGVCQHQAIGAAVAFGRLHGLKARNMENALGLAGTLTCLPSLRKYNWESRPLVSFKDFAGPVAETGVRAVLMDRAGLIGAQSVFDGETGFWRMIGSDRFDAGVLADGLGETWLCRHLSFKAYPTCRWMHTALESFETAWTEHRLQAFEIESIEILTSATLANDFMDRTPETMIDAQFSLPFCLAKIALGEAPALWHQSLSDPRLPALTAKIGAMVDAEIDAAMKDRRPVGQVRIHARHQTFEGPRLPLPRGTGERPLSQEGVTEKFRANAEAAGFCRTEALLDIIMTLEQHVDVAQALSAVLPQASQAGLGKA